jgi:REP element-mobilizing transposase RayT
MARSLRIDVPHGWYHVLNRGVERRQIFPRAEANLHFLNLLGCLPSRFGVRVHAYVLMGNHYHLQVETPQANLSRAMQWLNLSYAAWFNRRQQRAGPLFQGRFNAILHDPESVALQINRYIHLNPIRVKALGGHEARSGAEDQLDAGGAGAGPSRELVKARVEALSRYRWSSYQVYVGKARNPGWLTTESIYRFFGDHTLHSLQGAYRRQLEEMAALGHWETGWQDSTKATILVGPDKFIQKMLGILKGDRREQTGVRVKERMSVDWENIIEAVTEVWGQQWDALANSRGNGALPTAFFLGQRFGGLRLKEMGELAGGVEYPAVNAAIARFEKRLKIDRDLQKKFKKVAAKLKIEI